MGSNQDAGCDSFPFQLGEIVLAKYEDRLYEAEILEIDHDRHGWKVYVHYCNWNHGFDHWLRPHLVLKDTKENRKKKEDRDKQDNLPPMMEMEKSAKTTDILEERDACEKRCINQQLKRKVDISDGEMPMKTSLSENKLMKKRKSMPINEDEEMPTKKCVSKNKSMKIIMPPLLMNQLVDDRDRIMIGNLLEIPRSPNVELILSLYKKYKKKKEPSLADSVERISEELCGYFDRALLAKLLYKGERQQYEKAIANHALAPSKIYGAEHLLRLLHRLPELVNNAPNIDDQTRVELEQSMVDLLEFLNNSYASFFRGQIDLSKLI